MIFPEFIAFRYWLKHTNCSSCRLAMQRYGRIGQLEKHSNGTYHLWGYVY